MALSVARIFLSTRGNVMTIGTLRFGLMGANNRQTTLLNNDTNTDLLVRADQGKIDLSGNYTLSGLGSVPTININENKKGLQSNQAFSFIDSSNYIKFGSSNNPIYGTGDFTIECWVYFDSSYSGLGQRYIVTTKAGGPQPGFEVVIFPPDLTAGVVPSGYHQTSTFPQDEWVFIAFSRKNGNGYLYVNTDLIDSGINTENNSGGGVEEPSIGNRTADPVGHHLGGHIAELRISNIGRYSDVVSPVL